MKQFLLSLLAFFWISAAVRAQVVCEPLFPNVDDDVTIYFHADEGNAALTGVSPVYAHMGVITNLSQSPTDWKHVTTTWGIADPVGTMQFVSPNLWKKSFNIRTFFNIPANETVLKLAFVFRNTSGSTVGRAADGADIFYDVYPDDGAFRAALLKPAVSGLLLETNDPVEVRAIASASANLTLYDNGVQLGSATGQLLETTINAGNVGLHQVDFVAITPQGEADTASFVYAVPGVQQIENPPAGTEPGIQYLDGQSVRLSLYAPGKQVIFATGDWSDWIPDPTYQMKRSEDGNTWWIDITGLTPGEPYRFQYLVDGILKIADPLSTLVLDPWNDPYISALTYPNMPAYPVGKTTGVVSVLQTAQTPFNWQAVDYERPKKTDLVVYELLMRDFLARHDYPTLLDTLDYLERLGVTAIEFMPLNEFDGNINWGYGPSFHKALDKYYGDAETLKRVIDECHKRNIAVILDVVFNQATSASPLARLYWDAANDRPAANNPWLNPEAKHDFNVFNDFNHESQATKTYVKNCLKHWISEFRFDGFRFDLSKGFTQKNTVGNVNAWGAYDASRITILKDYADFIWDLDPDNYVILEHFADNSEEKELAQYGMMLWGKMWNPFKDIALGYSSGVGASLTGLSYKQRTWTVPHLIGYMESHDEDRIGYECLTYGNPGTPGHNVRSPIIYLKRLEMLQNLLFLVPGPKMLWQFGEVGYDFHINLCEDGNIDDGCRTGPKPIRWDYYDDPYRRRLYDVTAALLNLRKNHDVFETTNFNADIGPGKIREITLNGTEMDAYLIANIGVLQENTQLVFPHSGWWYEYYTGDSILAPTPNAFIPVTLKAGEYRLYLDQYVPLPGGLNPTPVTEAAGYLRDMLVYPNPAYAVFAIDFTLEESSDVQLEVRNLNGQLVYTDTLKQLAAAPQHLEIETGGWQAGVYAVTLRDKNGAQVAARLIKL